jgi:hypothetical protein
LLVVSEPAVGLNELKFQILQRSSKYLFFKKHRKNREMPFPIFCNYFLEILKKPGIKNLQNHWSSNGFYLGARQKIVCGKINIEKIGKMPLPDCTRFIFKKTRDLYV